MGCRAGPRRVALLLGLALLPGATPAQAPTRYTARRLLDFHYLGEPPMRMPTGVAVAGDGRVVVADGVNDRVLQFTPGGEMAAEIRQIGEETLSRPLSVHVDGAGRLWIADTGHQRVLVRAADGTLERVIRLEQGTAARPPDITDAVPREGGQSVWLVDNDNHRLVLVDVLADTRTVVGAAGESLGQFQHPFMAALGRGGDVFVTDVINARVQVLSSAGQPVGRVGAYGADLGQLYRPKGVACDADGNVWVSDGVLNAVQVFTPTGRFLDVLRDGDGQPLKLDMPVGLAFDTEGNLYVVELLADRVSKLSITVGRAAPAASGAVAPAAGQAASQRSAAGQGQACTICHIEWLPPLDQGRSTPLFAAAGGPADDPLVSRATTCLSCHDGSVVDSRHRVWQAHGHGTGIAPPEGMKVPARLPLVGGRLACRTCHSAHVSGAPLGDIGTAVFLRVQNVAGELCISCHSDKTRGPALGTHPTGGMPWPVPKELVAAGARVGPNPRELTCQVCHTAHGSAYDHLLVMGTQSNQLCLACHDQMRPGMFRGGAATEHPLSPQVKPEQAEAVREMGTKLGAQDRLICLTCHRLHHGQGERFMLADDLQDGRMCLRCHAERRELLGSSHDLRGSFPEERNRLGMTPATGGPCSACHLFHRYARAPEASDLDPGGGKCVTCHQAGRVAQAKVLGPVNHPQTRCTDCHNPHVTRFGNYLAAPASERCRNCHADYAAIAGGPHDVAHQDKRWPAEAASSKDMCLACHRPHGTEQTGLYRVGLAEGVTGPDARCLPCHADARPGTGAQAALAHPRDAGKLQEWGDLPLATDDEGQKEVACRTCHNPHVGASTSAQLLRIDAGAAPQQVCLKCHSALASIDATGHAVEPLRGAGFKTAACRPCHAVHAGPQTVERHYLWPTRLAADVPAGAPAADRHCAACHRTGGPVAPPTIATHPKSDLFNPEAPDAPGFLPLFNADGAVDADGSIGCRTCHLTHGRSTAAALPETDAALTPRELRARKWHVRSFAAGNVCKSCHGFDGLRRFMYFHDPSRRGGPIEPGGGTTPAAQK